MPFKQNRLGLARFSTSRKAGGGLRKEISAATELLVRCGKSHQMKKNLVLPVCRSYGEDLG